MKRNKTKIICTIGPSSCDKKTLQAMANAGMDIARINMSHGDFSFYHKTINNIRSIKNIKVQIMTDTKGPEIRVGQLSKNLVVNQGSIITIKTKDFHVPKTANTFYVYDSTYSYNMAKDLKVGKRILVDDGKLLLLVTFIDVKKGIIKAIAQNSHTIMSNKRINLPDSHYTLPFLSQRDKQSIIDSIKLKTNSIALSFVNSAKDVNDVRKILIKNHAKQIKLISKIETQQALDNINEIIKASDGIMIARGDLALETPFWNVPFHQKKIIALCHKAKKFVIVATQMLDSLERNLQPTRAEVTDVYYAVLLKANATMLSGETASGKYPVNAIKVMAKINAATEKIVYK